MTRQSLIDALESLLNEKPFEAIGVAEIAGRAGRSVGSFYTKFKDKEELLEAVLRRYEDERGAMQDSSVAPDKWVGAGLRERIDGIARITVKEFRSRRGLFLAHEARARLRQQQARQGAGEEMARASSRAPIGIDAHEKMMPLYDIVSQSLTGCADEISHKDPERAARFAFLMLTSLCSKAILHSQDSHPASLCLSDEEVALRSADMMYAYLTAGGFR